MKYIIGSIAVAAALFGATATAQAAGDIVSDKDCCAFVEDTFTQAAGEVPNYVNPAGSDSVHNVTSTQTGAGGKPIFESKTIKVGSVLMSKYSPRSGSSTIFFVSKLISLVSFGLISSRSFF